ncbi:MAG: alkaline phosphatase [Pseudomonadota bacterium]
MPSSLLRMAAASAALLLAACAQTPVDELRPASANARNVILFIGDGMGISTVTAARIFDGQSRGESGEENVLSFERFPNLALVKTYNSNQQVPDSAGTATAMHTGVKTRSGVIGVGPEGARRDCVAARQAELPTIADAAKANGKQLGIVTTARITHATPATVYAHLPERDWEADDYFTDEHRAAGCVDIARQFVDLPLASAPDITLGGGWSRFRSASVGGKRVTDGEDLVAEWLAAQPGRQFISRADELADIRPGRPVLGLFSRSHMEYEVRREANTTQPGIVAMTEAAIDYLEAADSGYYLMVEGARIDHGHHDGVPGLALSEAQAFANAVQAAVDRVDLKETLILVTADHSHVFTLAGYPTRGNDILGLVVGNDRTGEPRDEPTLAADGQPYTTVGYANGRNAIREGPRPRPDTGMDAVAQSLVPVRYELISGEISYDETHAGEDVALYAIGPGADAVGGVIEQNLIFEIMLDAFGFAAAERTLQGTQ